MIEVTYIDHMGSDLSVVNAARVSFGKTHKAMTEGDTKLIKYLAKHKHMSPFGHAFASFHVKAPIFVARQLVKHKFLRWNEVSRRYVDDEPEFYEPSEWRGRSEDKKQGSSDKVIDTITVSKPDYEEAYMYPEDKMYLLPWINYTEKVRDAVSFCNTGTLQLYEHLIEAGIAPEQARMVLPQSTMTEWYWSGSLDAFIDMCNLRCKLDTQYETRLVADYIRSEMIKLFPVSVEALVK
jgi:thymidylate synthase (FAD)